MVPLGYECDGTPLSRKVELAIMSDCFWFLQIHDEIVNEWKKGISVLYFKPK
jgi:hypothetical protein